MSRAWLKSLVRARQVQEDVARERLASAHRHARHAQLRALAEDDRIDELTATGHEEVSTTLAFVAAASARQAAAATWAAAHQTRAIADGQVEVRATAVTAAARQRRSAEKLAERDAADERSRAATAMQNELDDIGGQAARKHRSTG